MKSKDSCVRLEVFAHLSKMGEAMMISKALRRCAMIEKLASKGIKEACCACA